VERIPAQTGPYQQTSHRGVQGRESQECEAKEHETHAVRIRRQNLSQPTGYLHQEKQIQKRWNWRIEKESDEE